MLRMNCWAFALATEIDTNDTDTDVLVQANHLSGVADIPVGQL